MSTDNTSGEEVPHLPGVSVGDRVRFTPGANRRRWWRVLARDEHHVVAVRQAAFEPKGTLEYTVTGWTGYRYNGEGPGLIRSSLNVLGGGWDLSDPPSGAAEILEALASGEFELSDHRRIRVESVEVSR